MTSLVSTYEQACDEAAVRPNSALTRFFAVTNFANPLQVLSLSANLLGPRGLTALLPVLRECRQSLHTLDLSRNELDSASVRQLAHFFGRGSFTALRRVELRGNPFTYQAGKHLVHWCDGTQTKHRRVKPAGIGGAQQSTSTTSAQDGSTDLWRSTPTASSLFCATEMWCEEAEVHVDYIGIEDSLMPPGLIRALQGRIADAVARREHRRTAGSPKRRSYGSERVDSLLPAAGALVSVPVPHAPLRHPAFFASSPSAATTPASAAETTPTRTVRDARAPTSSPDMMLSSALSSTARVLESGEQDAGADAMPAFLQDDAPTTDAEAHSTTTAAAAATGEVAEAAGEVLPAFLGDSPDAGDADVAAAAAPTAQPVPCPVVVEADLTELLGAYDDATPQDTSMATSDDNEDAVAAVAAAALADTSNANPLAPPPPPPDWDAADAVIDVEGAGNPISALSARMRAQSTADTAPYLTNSGGGGPLGTGTMRPPPSPPSSSAEAMAADDEDVAPATASRTDLFLPRDGQAAEEGEGEPPYVPAHKTASDILDELEIHVAPAGDSDAAPPWLKEG